MEYNLHAFIITTITCTISTVYPLSSLQTSTAGIHKLTVMLWAWCEQCLATTTQTKKAVVIFTLRKLSHTQNSVDKICLAFNYSNHKLSHFLTENF